MLQIPIAMFVVCWDIAVQSLTPGNDWTCNQPVGAYSNIRSPFLYFLFCELLRPNNDRTLCCKSLTVVVEEEVIPLVELSIDELDNAFAIIPAIIVWITLLLYEKDGWMDEMEGYYIILFNSNELTEMNNKS